VRKRSDSNSTDVGHEGVITGCDAFSLRSSIANPRGVAQPPLQSTTSHNIRFNKMISNFWFIETLSGIIDQLLNFIDINFPAVKTGSLERKPLSSKKPQRSQKFP